MYCGALVAGPAKPPPAAAPEGGDAPLAPLRVTSGYIRPRRSWGTAAVLLVLAAGGAWAAWTFLRPRAGGDDDAVRIGAGDVHVWTREVRQACEFRFTVTALEGDCAAASGPVRSAAGVSAAEKEGLDALASPIRAGETRVLLGKCRPGPYAWAVFAGRKNGVRVRVAFDLR